MMFGVMAVVFYSGGGGRLCLLLAGVYVGDGRVVGVGVVGVSQIVVSPLFVFCFRFETDP